MSLRLEVRRHVGRNVRRPTRKTPGQSGWNVRPNVRRNLPDTGDLIPETGNLIPPVPKSTHTLTRYAPRLRCV